MNLKQVVPDICHDMICKEIDKEFRKWHHDCEIIEETIDDPVSTHPRVKEIYETFISQEWLMKKTPEFTNEIETRFPWGNIDMFLKVENGIFFLEITIGMIQDGMVYSDSQVPDLIDNIIHELRSKAFMYSETGMSDLCDSLSYKYHDREDCLGMIEDIRNWAMKAI